MQRIIIRHVYSDHYFFLHIVCYLRGPMAQKLRHIPIYTQQYRFTISEEFKDKNIIDFFSERFSFKPREYWIRLLEEGDISVNNQGVDVDYILMDNDVVRTLRRDVQEPAVNADYKILFDDDGVLVIDKPAPLPVHPAGRYFKNSLLSILKENNPDIKFHTIHRLDSWTTGVLVLATNKERARVLHLQVEKKTVKKAYGVLAGGDFGEQEFTIDEAVGRVDGAFRGVGPEITEAKDSVTLFKPLIKKGDVTLLMAQPLTGRTNQIRVHVQAAGGYVLNDPLYSPRKSEIIPYMGLHCREMTFRLYPGEEAVTFKAPWPDHFLKYFSRTELDDHM